MGIAEIQYMPRKQAKSHIFPKIDRRYMWMGLGIITLLINALFRSNPYFTEVVYSRGIFLVIRWIWDFSLGLIPIPLLYIFVPLVLFYLIRRWRKGKPHRQARPLINRLGSMLVSVLGLAGIALFLFYFLWGFNYNRLPVAQQLKLNPGELSDEEVEKEYKIATEEMIEALNAMTKDYKETVTGIKLSPKNEKPVLLDSLHFARMYENMDSINEAYYYPENLESQIREHLIQQLEKYNYPTPGRPRARMIRPKGLLMQLGATGIYFPYVAEGNIDFALSRASKPNTMAHELAHAYGFGDEGTCNFWAYLTCTQADQPFIKYSGHLNYWRKVAGFYRSRNPEAYKDAIKKLPSYIIHDLKKMDKIRKQYPGFFPRFSRAFYERYLKAQGIKEGQKSYSKVVSYVVAFRKRQEDI